MKQRTRPIIALVLTIAMAMVSASCTTLGNLQPGMGVPWQVEGHSYDDVWEAANTAIAKHLAIVEQDKTRGVIKATGGIGLTSWGEVVAVYISPPGPAESHTIESISRKRSMVQITGPDWTDTILRAIEHELKNK